jgi:hypothetical protein
MTSGDKEMDDGRISPQKKIAVDGQEGGSTNVPHGILEKVGGKPVL